MAFRPWGGRVESNPHWAQRKTPALNRSRAQKRYGGSVKGGDNTGEGRVPVLVQPQQHLLKHRGKLEENDLLFSVRLGWGLGPIQFQAK